MDAAASLAFAAETPHRPTRQRSSHRHQRDPVDCADRQSVACPARVLRLVEDGFVPLLPVAESRDLGRYPGCRSATSRCRGPAGLVPAFRGQHRGPCPSTRSGSQGGDAATEALGRSRGGYSTKIHVRCERDGKPMVTVLTGGERHEQPVLPLLMERGAVKRIGRGRPRLRPDRVAGAKGNSSDKVRQYLKERRIGTVIPTKTDEAPDPGFDRAAYRERNVVERLINRLKQWRRIATRYEKRAANYRAMVMLGMILLWL